MEFESGEVRAGKHERAAPRAPASQHAGAFGVPGCELRARGLLSLGKGSVQTSELQSLVQIAH